MHSITVRIAVLVTVDFPVEVAAQAFADAL
jgi:hypothetical protein